METGSNAKPPREWRPWVASGLIAAVVLAVVIGVRSLGWWQPLEFAAYDALVRARPAATGPSAPVVLIGVRESDIQSAVIDYPLWDDCLARLLCQLEAEQPAVIGLDIYRDLPVPKSGEHLAELNKVLLKHNNIIGIWSYGGWHATTIRPPPALADKPERIGFNDFVADFDGKVRRALLYQDDGKKVFESFALRLALVYLSRTGLYPIPDPVHPERLRLGRATFRPFERNDGPYVRADAGGYQMLLDYRGPRHVDNFSLAEVLGGRVPPGVFHDRIVLIGMDTESVPDFHPTPLKPSQLGLEIHAHVIDQLLRGALVGDTQPFIIPDWQEALWTICWGLVGGFIGFRVRSPGGSALLIATALVALVGCVWFAFDRNWWLSVAMPAIACVGTAGAVNWYISYHEKQQRALVMLLFSKQVSREIAENIWQRRREFLAGGRPRPQKLTATVLFTDLEGFSTVSEKRDPQLVMEWLNEYMEGMTKVVQAHQGVVEKFIGDSLMVVFGVPLPRTRPEQVQTDAVQAIRCALAMDRRLQELNARPAAGRTPLRMRIGIHTGPLIAGSVGSGDRQEYTVLGDTVNTAARLESHDKEQVIPERANRCCRILISDDTRQLLGDRFVTKLIGTMSLKGKTNRVTVHLVLEEKRHDDTI